MGVMSRGLVRVRSRKGVVHLAYSDNGKTHAHTLCLKAALADGKITTRGKVTCRGCIEMRGDKNAMRLLRGVQERPHPVTNDYRAAKRGNRYLAHWVLQPYYDHRKGDFLGEHRLYEPVLEYWKPVSERVETPSTYGGVYYCPECDRIGKRTGPDGLPKGDVSGTPLEFLEEFNVPFSGGDMEPGEISPDDPTIHETGRKMPRGETQEQRRKRMMTDLVVARRKWRSEHEPSMAADSP